MGKHRMFSTDITRSDAFLEMPATSRLLYYDLNQEADDEGFVGNPKSIMRMTGASYDDMNMLLAKKFVIIPDEAKGIVVIKHWFIHNYIRKDRLIETNYKDVKALLDFDENGCYKLNGNQVTTICQPDVNQVAAQDKGSKEKSREVKRKYGEYRHVLLTDTEKEKLENDYGKETAESYIRILDEGIELKGYRYKSHYLAIRKWIANDGVKKSQADIKADYSAANEEVDLSVLDDFIRGRGNNGN